MNFILFILFSVLCLSLFVITRYFENKRKTQQKQFSSTLKKEKIASEQKIRQFEHQQLKIKKENSQLANHIVDLEKKNEALQLELNKNLELSTKTITSLKEQHLEFDRDNEHYKAQVNTLTSQLTILTHEKKDLKRKYERKKKITQDLNKITEKEQQTYRLLKKERKISLSLNKELEQEKKKKQGYDLDELLKIKKRLRHYQHFYSVVSSQKKMLEERTINWELALKLISTWVLDHHQVKCQPTMSLGEKVS